MYNFSPEIKKAILAEVTKDHAITADRLLCDITGNDCNCCPYMRVLGKYCGAGDSLVKEERLARAHELIKACGFEIPLKSSISSSDTWNRKQEDLSLLLVDKLHSWSRRTGTIFISSLKSTDIQDIADAVLENIFGEPVDSPQTVEGQENHPLSWTIRPFDRRAPAETERVEQHSHVDSIGCPDPTQLEVEPDDAIDVGISETGHKDDV